MAQFEWPLQEEMSLKICNYTPADYFAVRARERPDHRPRQNHIVKVLFDVRCDCSTYQKPGLLKQLVDGIPRGRPDSPETMGLVSESGATTPVQLDMRSLQRDSCYLSPHPAIQKHDHTAICRSGGNEDDVREDVDSGTTHEEHAQSLRANPNDVPARVHGETGLVHTVIDESHEREPTEEDDVPIVEDCASLPTDKRPVQAWTRESNCFLVELRDEAQLSWSEIMTYFPGRTKAGLSQHYSRLKKLTATAALSKQRRTKLVTRATAAASKQRRTSLVTRATAPSTMSTTQHSKSRSDPNVARVKSQHKAIDYAQDPAQTQQLPSSRSGRERFRPRHHIKDGYACVQLVLT